MGGGGGGIGFYNNREEEPSFGLFPESLGPKGRDWCGFQVDVPFSGDFRATQSYVNPYSGFYSLPKEEKKSPALINSEVKACSGDLGNGTLRWVVGLSPS